MSDSYSPLRIVETESSRLAVIGELDLAGVAVLEEQLAHHDGDLVLDCSGLTFVDASGLGLLVHTRNACEARGAKFALVEPSACLMRLLSITELDEVFLASLDRSGR